MKRNFIFCLILFVIILTCAQVSFSKDTVKLYFFYSEGTGGLKIEKEVIKPLSQKYPLEIRSFSVDQLKNYDLLIKFEKEWKANESEIPAVIIGNRILGGESEIKRDLEGLVKFHAEKGGGPLALFEGGSWPGRRLDSKGSRRSGEGIWKDYLCSLSLHARVSPL